MTPERLALRRLIAVEEAASNLSRSLHELHDVCPVCEEPEGEHYADCLSGALHEALSLPEPIQGGAYPDLLSHVDAITADRDEARQEVAALRAQRDEIREAHRVELAAQRDRILEAQREARDGLREQHRVEVAALAARLEAAERVRDASVGAFGEVCGKTHALQARTDAAEAKLAALVEAWDGLCMANAAWSPVGPQACRDAVPVARDKFHAAMGAARGEL